MANSARMSMANSTDALVTYAADQQIYPPKATYQGKSTFTYITRLMKISIDILN
jgi:hypothetical protein